jgi:HSP20 family protein
METNTNTQLANKDDRSVAERLAPRAVIAPAVDVYEGKDELLVVADVPGARPDGVDVRLERQELSVNVRRDGGWPDFGRAFLVPRSVDAQRISAELKHGVLTIRLPKTEASKPRQIAVRAG